MSQKNVFFVMGEPQIVPFLPLVVKRGFHKSYSFNNNNRPKITSLLVLLVTFMRYVGNNNISFDVVFKYGHNDVLFIHNKVKLKEINGETQR